jgi:hypothetical protein
MSIRQKHVIPLFVLLVCGVAACGSQRKFVAPEIEPPSDLIPAYIPKGYKLISGFQLIGENKFPVNVWGDNALIGRLGVSKPFFDLKSPSGNIIQGVYYQGKDHLILITKSYFPDGSLDIWRKNYEASILKFDDCECCCLCRPLRLFPLRFIEIQEEHTIGDAQVIVLKGPLGLITVFVRGDYLLTVESGISLDENLKIVASLLEK